MIDNIDSLASGLTSYLEKDQVNSVRRAYYYAEQAHEGQFDQRVSCVAFRSHIVCYY